MNDTEIVISLSLSEHERSILLGALQEFSENHGSRTAAMLTDLIVAQVVQAGGEA